MSIQFDADDQGLLILEITDEVGGVFLSYPLNLNEETRLIEHVLDGRCPICYEEIPMNSRVCCDCLGEIANYHELQDGCIRIQRG